MYINDTIAAISTAPGRGAIAIIRLSGENAIEVAEKVFKPKTRTLSTVQPGYSVYGNFYAGKAGIGKDGSIAIDDGVGVIRRAPHSFTGEDMVELSCHGGTLVTRCILEELFAHGARSAEAGEFTRRAYCNGKLDLPQAEAISLTLEAQNRDALIITAAQRGGTLSNKINSIFNELTFLIAAVYVYIDFPDESLSDVAPNELKSKLEYLLDSISALRSSYRTGKAIAEGISTAICGKPNCGKSSLLNKLLCEERAIVTDIAGTTRDTIEETAVVGGVTLRLCDTAGIRDTSDTIEKIGISRSIAAAESSELVIAMFDGASKLDDDDRKFIDFLNRLRNNDKKIIVLINKSDLQQLISVCDLKSMLSADDFIAISTVTKEGIDKLYKTLGELYLDGTLKLDSDAIITSSRQHAALKAAEVCLQDAVAALDTGMTADIVGLDLEEALGKLGELDGRSVSEEVVDNIFHNFCVGK